MLLASSPGIRVKRVAAYPIGMAFRIIVSALVLVSRSWAICDAGEQCLLHEDESLSTLQIQRDVATNFSNADCVQFYTRDCGLHRAESPNQIEDMRAAFLQCCIEKGNYSRDVCHPFMEQIFKGHGQASALLCSKLSSAHKEHRRLMQMLQTKADVDTRHTGVTRADLDMSVSRKLGFGGQQKDFACAEDWEKRLSRASKQKNVGACMHQCEFAPECEAISYKDETCVLCGTPTMAYRQDWTTYVKKGTTKESRAHCKSDSDCDYPACNTGGSNGWGFECLKTDKSGRCVNRIQQSLLCKDRADDEMPVPGHWCLSHDLYRVCPQRPDDDDKH